MAVLRLDAISPRCRPQMGEWKGNVKELGGERTDQSQLLHFVLFQARSRALPPTGNKKNVFKLFTVIKGDRYLAFCLQHINFILNPKCKTRLMRTVVAMTIR